MSDALPLLKRCDLQACEARCCYDGVYLRPEEETAIKAVVGSAPDFFATLPAEPIIDGSWGGMVEGRKTAVKPHTYRAPDFPAHFSATRCVFCSNDHRCMLQVLAVERGLHPWAYKPQACWLFPLRIVNGQAASPPAPSEADPHDLGPSYPGYSKFTPCGSHRSDGAPWSETLKDEVEYLQGGA